MAILLKWSQLKKPQTVLKLVRFVSSNANLDTSGCQTTILRIIKDSKGQTSTRLNAWEISTPGDSAIGILFQNGFLTERLEKKAIFIWDFVCQKIFLTKIMIIFKLEVQFPAGSLNFNHFQVLFSMIQTLKKPSKIPRACLILSVSYL